MKKSEFLKRMHNEVQTHMPDVLADVMTSLESQGLIKAGQPAAAGAAHASAASAGSTKLIINSLIAALAVTAAVGATVGASLAVNGANQPGGVVTPPPVIENPDPSEPVVGTEGLVYSKMSDGCYSVKGIGTVTDAEIVVPKTYEGEPVTVVGNNAFRSCKTITSVTLPDSITTISQSAFSGCTNLTQITLPDSLYGIGARAFENCFKLKSITLPDSVRLLADFNFSMCYNLESVTLPANLTYIADGLFDQCEKLTQIKLPEKIATVGRLAFSRSGLTSIEIPASVKRIGNSAFDECKNLTSVSINSDMTVGVAAFFGCELLSDIDVGDKEVFFDYEAIWGTAYENNIANYQDNLLYIGKNLISAKGPLYHIEYTIKWDTLTISPMAFRPAQKSLTEIYIPSTVRRIGEGVFNYCEELEKITVASNNHRYYSDGNCLIERDTQTLIAGCKTSVINDNVLHIGDRAFYAITTLERITFNSTLKSIGVDAFGQCDGLGQIVFPHPGNIEIGDGAFRHCPNLHTVFLGASVTELSHYMFLEDTSVESITVTSALRKIRHEAFRNCFNLKTIYFDGDMAQWKEIEFEGEEYYIDGVRYMAYGLTDFNVVCKDGTLHYD